MKTIVKNSFIALALATVTFACGDNTKSDNVEGVVDSTAVTEPTMDEAMSTSGDTATVVRTDSTALQEAKQMTNEATDATKNAAGDVKDAAKDATR